MPQGLERLHGHPGYYRRPGSPTVWFRYRGANGTRPWGKAPTIAAGKRERARLQTEASDRSNSADGQQTVPEYGRLWLESYTGRTRKGIREVSLDDYKRRLELDAFRFFDGVAIVDVTAPLVRAFYADVSARGAICRSCRAEPEKMKSCRNCGGSGHKGELSKDAVRLAIAPFKAMMATAHQKGVIPRNTTAGVRLGFVERGRSEEDAEFDEEDGDDEPVRVLSQPQLASVLDLVAERAHYWLLSSSFS